MRGIGGTITFIVASEVEFAKAVSWDAEKNTRPDVFERRAGRAIAQGSGARLDACACRGKEGGLEACRRRSNNLRLGFRECSSVSVSEPSMTSECVPNCSLLVGGRCDFSL